MERQEIHAVRPKAPCRKRFEAELSKCKDEISVTHKALKELQSEIGKFITSLQSIKLEKNTVCTDRKNSEDTIRSMSVEINKLSTAFAQLQSKILYRDEKKLDEALRKLQGHLQNHHFSYSEEKKIVAEIDNLNRSRKLLGQYSDVKKELNDLRQKQGNFRTLRDKHVRRMTELRKQEEVFRVEIHQLKQEESQLKSDLDKFYDQKKAITASFSTKQQQYSVSMAEFKEQQKLVREQERQVQAEAKQKEREELAALIQPYHQEKQVCSLLIQYVERLLNTNTHQSCHRHDKQKKKRVVHSPEVLGQFLSVDIRPPAQYGQLEASLQQLNQQVEHYNTLAQSEMKELHNTKSTSSVPTTADQMSPSNVDDQYTYCAQETLPSKVTTDQNDNYLESEEIISVQCDDNDSNGSGLDQLNEDECKLDDLDIECTKLNLHTLVEPDNWLKDFVSI